MNDSTATTRNARIYSDDELIEQIKAGDRTAFENLVRRHRAGVVAQAQRLLHDRDEAETAAQEVCMRVLRSIDRFQGDARFTTWLYRVTENVCRTMLMRNKREVEKADAFAAEVDELLEEDGTQDTQAFERMLGGLANDERQLLVLRFVMDHEIRDIALIMGSGLSATKMRMYRALDKVRNQIQVATAA